MTPRHNRRWGGSQSTQARKAWATRLPVACCRCGRPVIDQAGKPGGGWQVDHWPVPREFGGKATWPAHSKCNLAAGGRRGAEITNGRKRRKKINHVISRGAKIRGI